MSFFRPDEVWVERAEIDQPLVATVRERLPGVPVRVVDDVRAAEAGDFVAGKRRLVLKRHRGPFLQSCPAGTGGLVCCNYLVVNFASNCPLDCSYCFLQEYLANNPALKAFTNVADGLAEIGRVLEAHPERSFRIGTGELADSLALDPITGLSRLLVPFFADYPNASLELKTKTACVDDLLDLDPRGRVVVSWSMNAPEVIAGDEHGSASLDERLDAARRVARAGYRVGFHFDPLVHFDGWEESYVATVGRVFSSIDAAAVSWVSLGSLRLTPGLGEIMRRRGRSRHALAGELVATADGKRRVWHGLRLRMYRSLVRELRAAAPRVPIYMCMEGPAMWKRVMGEIPSDRALGLRLAGVAW